MFSAMAEMVSKYRSIVSALVYPRMYMIYVINSKLTLVCNTIRTSVPQRDPVSLVFAL